MDLLERINRHLRQLAPHQKDRAGMMMLAEARDEILKLQNDMDALREMWNRNSLGAWADDTDTLAKIMTHNEQN